MFEEADPNAEELRLHVAPVVLGSGARPFDGVAPVVIEQVSSRATSLVTHITYRIALTPWSDRSDGVDRTGTPSEFGLMGDGVGRVE